MYPIGTCLSGQREGPISHIQFGIYDEGDHVDVSLLQYCEAYKERERVFKKRESIKVIYHTDNAMDSVECRLNDDGSIHRVITEKKQRIHHGSLF